MRIPRKRKKAMKKKYGRDEYRIWFVIRRMMAKRNVNTLLITSHPKEGNELFWFNTSLNTTSDDKSPKFYEDHRRGYPDNEIGGDPASGRNYICGSWEEQ